MAFVGDFIFDVNFTFWSHGLVGMQGINAGIGAIAMQASVPFAAIIVWLIYREKAGLATICWIDYFIYWFTCYFWFA